MAKAKCFPLPKLQHVWKTCEAFECFAIFILFATLIGFEIVVSLGSFRTLHGQPPKGLNFLINFLKAEVKSQSPPDN